MSSRRDFLKFAALAGAAGMAGSPGFAVEDEITDAEPETRTSPVPGTVKNEKKQYDVVVAGGGLAGVAAAVAAARAGQKTALIEKTFFPGGLATSGLIVWYSFLDDGIGNQIIFGIGEEMLLASLKYGPGWIYGGWHEKDKIKPGHKGRYNSHFNPASCVLSLDEMLTKAGVSVWYDTLVCQPVLKGDRITGLEVENRDGRRLFEAGCVVDATGEAIVAHRAGAPCDEVKHELVMGIYEASLEQARKAAEKGRGTGVRKFGLKGLKDKGKFDCNSAEEISRFALESRDALREYYAIEQAGAGEDGRQNLYPILLPSLPQVRRNRKIQGLAALHSKDVGKEVDIPVGLVPKWWPKGAGLVWQVPYGALLPQKVKGLLTAGRTISAGGWGWEMTRVIAPVVQTGEVAGIAAALSAKHNTTPDALDAKLLYAELDRLGHAYKFRPEHRK